MDANHDPGDGGIRPSAILVGALLAVFGGTLLLNRGGLVHVSIGQLIGPAVLISLGAVTLVEKGGFACRARSADGTREPLRWSGGLTSGVWLIGIGLWLLVSQTHLWGLGFHNSWPLVVILSGVMMLLRGIR